MGKAKQALAAREAQYRVIDERTVDIRNRLTLDIEKYGSEFREAGERLDQTRAAILGLEEALKDARRRESIQQADYVRLRAEIGCRKRFKEEIAGLEDGEPVCPF